MKWLVDFTCSEEKTRQQTNCTTVDFVLAFTRTVKVRRTKVKCSLYVSQPGLVRELSKAHYDELVTASELDGVPFTLIAVDALFKLVCVYRRHNLCKYCFPLFIVCRIGCLYLLAKL